MDVSTALRIAAYIAEHGTTPATEIRERLKIAKSTLDGAVNALEGRRAIQRRYVGQRLVLMAGEHLEREIEGAQDATGFQVPGDPSHPIRRYVDGQLVGSRP